MPAIAEIKRHRRSIVDKYSTPNDRIGSVQVLTTLLPLAAIWWLVAAPKQPVLAVVAVATVGIGLLLLRSFALMHDCGHGSLFRNRTLNHLFGFVFGVLTGMPQYVWSRHHNYHHANNGNWAKYRGPLAVLSVEEFGALPARRQRMYAATRNIWLAPFAGLAYLIINPRLNWLRGTATLLARLGLSAIQRPKDLEDERADIFRSRYWASRTEYWHMTANNLVLFAVWAAACCAVGTDIFFPVYLISASLAGGAGIVLFSVQHNFEHSYASGNEGWDYDAAAINGTSYLALPNWLNWFTADIGFHHIHHISARIPNYRLAACHAEHQRLFSTVKRLTISDVKKALSYLLWDPESRRLISIEEHRLATQAASN